MNREELRRWLRDLLPPEQVAQTPETIDGLASSILTPGTIANAIFELGKLYGSGLTAADVKGSRR